MHIQGDIKLFCFVNAQPCNSAVSCGHLVTPGRTLGDARWRAMLCLIQTSAHNGDTQCGGDM